MSGDIGDLLATDENRLVPADAVVALITVGDGYLLQLRDLKPGIFYPGHWGLFGGAAEPGESEIETLTRELEEELELEADPATIRYFTRLTFDFAPLGGPEVRRSVYELALPREAERSLTLHEGREMRVFTPRAALDPALPVTPYDAFTLWMHVRRSRMPLP